MKWKLQKYRRPVLFAKSLIILKEKNCKNVVDYLPIQPLCFGKNAPRWNEISSLNNAAPSSAFPLFEHLLVFLQPYLSREKDICRPLGPQNSFLKRKKVKLLLPSPISILSSNDVRIFQSLATVPLPHPFIQRHWHVFGLGLWTFLWSFLRLIYSEGPIRWGEGRPSSAAGKIIVGKIKTSWSFRVFLKKLRGDYWWFSGAGEQDKDSCWRRSETK